MAYLTAGAIYEYRDTVDVDRRLPPVDAIICLAGGRGRIGFASRVWNQYFEAHAAQVAESANPGVRGNQDPQKAPSSPVLTIPKLYFSGMGKHADWEVLAKQVDPDILKNLDFKDVILETVSTNTRENAKLFHREAKKQGWKRFLLITSSYHMKRARYVFVRTLKGEYKRDEDKQQIRVFILSVAQPRFNSEEWTQDLNSIQVTLTEYLKWVSYRIFW